MSMHDRTVECWPIFMCSFWQQVIMCNTRQLLPSFLKVQSMRIFHERIDDHKFLRRYFHVFSWSLWLSYWRWNCKSEVHFTL